jgi:hypothetical protein
MTSCPPLSFAEREVAVRKRRKNPEISVKKVTSTAAKDEDKSAQRAKIFTYFSTTVAGGKKQKPAEKKTLPVGTSDEEEITRSVTRSKSLGFQEPLSTSQVTEIEEVPAKREKSLKRGPSRDLEVDSLKTLPNFQSCCSDSFDNTLPNGRPCCEKDKEACLSVDGSLATFQLITWLKITCSL